MTPTEKGAKEERIWNEWFWVPLSVAILSFSFSFWIRYRNVLLLMLLFSLVEVQAQESMPPLEDQTLSTQEDYAIQRYKNGDYRNAELLFRDIATLAHREQDRDRARYNASLAAYKQGELVQALSLIEEMESRTAVAQENHVQITKEIEERKKNQNKAPQSTQNEQGQGSSGDNTQEASEQGEGKSKQNPQADPQTSPQTSPQQEEQTSKEQDGAENTKRGAQSSKEAPTKGLSIQPQELDKEDSNAVQQGQNSPPYAQSFEVEGTTHHPTQQAEDIIDAVQEGIGVGFGTDRYHLEKEW